MPTVLAARQTINQVPEDWRRIQPRICHTRTISRRHPVRRHPVSPHGTNGSSSHYRTSERQDLCMSIRRSREKGAHQEAERRGVYEYVDMMRWNDMIRCQWRRSRDHWRLTPPRGRRRRRRRRHRRSRRRRRGGGGNQIPHPVCHVAASRRGCHQPHRYHQPRRPGPSSCCKIGRKGRHRTTSGSREARQAVQLPFLVRRASFSHHKWKVLAQRLTWSRRTLQTGDVPVRFRGSVYMHTVPE